MSDILDLTAVELRDAMTAGHVSAVEATEAYLDAIERVEPQVGAYNEVYADQARQQAAAIDAARAAGDAMGPLAGLPIAVKDNMCTAWGKTTCSSKILADFHAPYTATAVARLQAAGAVIVLRRKQPDLPRPYKVWGYPWVPVVFMAASAGILVSSLRESPVESLAGAGLTLLGIPVYLIWQRRRARTDG